MEIRKAGLADFEKLFDIRIKFIQLMKKEHPLSDEFIQASRDFIYQHLQNDSMTAFIAEEDGRIISAAFVCYYQIIPSISNPSGNTGYLQNVYTLPEYRGRGLASTLVRKIVEDARERKVSRLLLNATDMGRPVYDKVGFQNTVNEMILNL